MLKVVVIAASCEWRDGKWMSFNGWKFEEQPPPVPEAVVEDGQWVVEIASLEALLAFVKKVGNPCILYEPEQSPPELWGTSRKMWALQIFDGYL